MGHICYFSVTRENTVEALKAAADADALVPAGQSVQAAADGILDTIWPEDEPAPWLWVVTPAAAGLMPRCRIRMRAVGEAGAVTEYATDLTAPNRVTWSLTASPTRWQRCSSRLRARQPARYVPGARLSATSRRGSCCRHPCAEIAE